MKHKNMKNEMELSKTHSSNMNDFMSKQFKTIEDVTLKKTLLSTIITIKSDGYCNIIDASSKSLKDVFIYKDKIIGFYNSIKNTPKITDAVITIPMHLCPNDIPTIKSDVLSEYINTVELNIDNLINNRINNTAADKIDEDEFNLVAASIIDSTSDVELYKTKEKISKSSFKENTSLRDMISTEFPLVDVQVTTDYIDSTIIPFVTNYNMYKINLNRISREISADIKKGTSRLNLLHTVIEKFRVTNPDKKLMKFIDKYLFNAEKNFLELCAYITFVYIRTVNAFTFDCNNYIAFVDTFKNKYNIMSDVYEEIAEISNIFPLDGESLSRDFLSKGCNGLISYVENILNYHSFLITGITGNETVSSVDRSNKLQNVLDDITYDTYPYDNIKQMYGEISQGLDVVASKCDNYLESFDSLLVESGLISPLNTKYEKVVKAVLNINIYETDISLLDVSDGGRETVLRILKELQEFPPTIMEASSLATMVYNKISEISDRMKTNINGEYKHATLVQKAISFLNDFDDQYTEITETTMNALIKRIKSLNDLLEKYEITKDNVYHENTDLIDTLDIDLDRIFVKESIEDEIYEERKIFTDLLKEYHKERVYIETGIELYYEAEDKVKPEVIDNSGNNTQTQNNQNSQNNNQNTNGSTNNGTTTQSTTDKTESINNFKDKLVKVINDLITKLKSSLVKNTGGKGNSDWIKRAENSLSNRNYTNVAINTYPYEINFDTMSSDVDKCINNITNINTRLTTISSISQMYVSCLPVKEVKPHIDFKETNNNAFRDGLKKYYAVGTAPYEQKQFANSQCKDQVMKYLQFAKTFYNVDGTNKYSNLIDKVNKCMETATNDAMLNKLKAVNDPKLDEKLTWLRTTISAFCYAIIASTTECASAAMYIFDQLHPQLEEKQGEAQPNNENNTETNQ